MIFIMVIFYRAYSDRGHFDIVPSVMINTHYKTQIHCSNFLPDWTKVTVYPYLESDLEIINPGPETLKVNGESCLCV